MIIAKKIGNERKYLEKGFFCLWRRRKRRKISWEKNIWPAEEKEKDEIIWKKKIFFGGGEEKQMEKEANIWKISVFVDENKNEEGKGGKNMEKEFCG